MTLPREYRELARLAAESDRTIRVDYWANPGATRRSIAPPYEIDDEGITGFDAAAKCRVKLDFNSMCGDMHLYS